MSELVKRVFMYYTNDEQEAVTQMGAYIAEGYKNVTYAKVNQMKEPPKTDMLFVVMRIEGL